jgi:hypothetical protein
MERRRPGQRRELGPYRRHELLTGEISYPVLGYDGYGDGLNTNMAEFWRSGEYTSFRTFPGESKPWLFVRGDPHTLPWAAKVSITPSTAAKSRISRADLCRITH